MKNIPSRIHERRPLRIGLDCHGTIMDTLPAFIRLFFRHFKIKLDPKSVKRSHLLKHYLTEEQYEMLVEKVFAHIPYVVRWINPIPGSIEIIRLLLEAGHQITVVTSSDQKAVEAIIQWLLCRGLKLPIRAVGRKTLKGDLASEFDIFLEDRVTQAEDLLKNGAPFVFLLTTPANSETIVSKEIIRVDSWDAFYEAILNLESPIHSEKRVHLQ